MPERTAATGLIATLAVASSTMMLQAQTGEADYTSLPQEPKIMEEALSTAGITFMEALEKAETACTGTAVSCRALPTDEGVTYEVMVDADGTMRRVTVDGTSGEVSCPTMTLGEAIKAATAGTKGMIRDAVLDLLADPPAIRKQDVAGFDKMPPSRRDP